MTETLSRKIFAAAESIHLTSDDIFSSKVLQVLTDLNRYIGSLDIKCTYVHLLVQYVCMYVPLITYDVVLSPTHVQEYIYIYLAIIMYVWLICLLC